MRTTRILIAACALSAMVLAACSSSTSATPSSTATASSRAATPSPAGPSSLVATTKQSPPSSPPKSTPKVVPPTRTKAAVKPAAVRGPVVDPLTGGRVSTNPVIAVKIDNTYFEVAQFGVSDADVVFVEQVEGGLTRLIAVFHSKLPTEVGPVRSVRSTDAQLLPAFGRPGLVFSGGAGGPLADLAKTSIVDTSALGGAYFRSAVATGTYNLHADLTKVAAQATGLGAVRSIGLGFAPESTALTSSRTVHHIRVVMEQGTTEFTYGQGKYFRVRNGANVADYQGQDEVAQNVVVMNVKDTPDGTFDTNGQPSYLTQTVGSGHMTLFRDGHLVPGTWKRAKATDPFTFIGTGARPLRFKAGKTWVILAPQTAVTTVS